MNKEQQIKSGVIARAKPEAIYKDNEHWIASALRSSQ
jgi:hypothetical protein